MGKYPTDSFHAGSRRGNQTVNDAKPLFPDDAYVRELQQQVVVLVDRSGQRVFHWQSAILRLPFQHGPEDVDKFPSRHGLRFEVVIDQVFAIGPRLSLVGDPDAGGCIGRSGPGCTGREAAPSRPREAGHLLGYDLAERLNVTHQLLELLRIERLRTV